MLDKPVSITALSSVSALGSDTRSILQAYQSPEHLLTLQDFGAEKVWVGNLPNRERAAIDQLGNSNVKYSNLDDSVLYALYASRKAVKQAGWAHGTSFGINIGSSRGATSLFEAYHKEFITTGKAATLTSPTTTLGNISSWISHDLQNKGPVISHSITCSTALHAILNGIAWLLSGLSDRFLVGGSEAPLTPFTIAQMQALKLYSQAGRDSKYPCRTMDGNKSGNTMVLGEGAAVACLEAGKVKSALATIQGIGYATEELHHNVSISANARCFQDAMKMAIGDLPLTDVDVVIMHSPGTVKGDASEWNAIQQVFGANLPYVTTNKWKIGHTFGASGMLSVELAILLLKEQQAMANPFTLGEPPKKFRNILINAVGFGGNAVSILVSK
ncbi:MAG: beta-ketoacyl synthase N-terminal-like domain-containing protein [Bacteroidota bacterium]